jgi:hypothetical protein
MLLCAMNLIQDGLLRHPCVASTIGKFAPIKWTARFSHTMHAGTITVILHRPASLPSLLTRFAALFSMHGNYRDRVDKSVKRSNTSEVLSFTKRALLNRPTRHNGASAAHS